MSRLVYLTSDYMEPHTLQNDKIYKVSFLELIISLSKGVEFLVKFHIRLELSTCK